MLKNSNDNMEIMTDRIHGVYDIPIRISIPKGDIIGTCVSVDGTDAERYFEAGFAVISFDLPGHGDSDASEYFCETNFRLDLLTFLKYADDHFPNANNRIITASEHDLPFLMGYAGVQIITAESEEIICLKLR